MGRTSYGCAAGDQRDAHRAEDKQCRKRPEGPRHTLRRDRQL